MIYVCLLHNLCLIASLRVYIFEFEDLNLCFISPVKTQFEIRNFKLLISPTHTTLVTRQLILQ